jgi:hypothetical protein
VSGRHRGAAQTFGRKLLQGLSAPWGTLGGAHWNAKRECFLRAIGCNPPAGTGVKLSHPGRQNRARLAPGQSRRSGEAHRPDDPLCISSLRR